MKRLQILTLFTLICALVLGATVQPAHAQAPTVQAVFFYSPTCQHCHKVIDEVLPPLLDEFGEQLKILQVNVTTNAGQALYQNYLRAFQVPDDRVGVPALIAGEVFMVGSAEIPNEFPQIIAQALAANGLEWPALPELDSYLEGPEAAFFGDAPAPTVIEKFQQDLFGNTLAVIVLAGMVYSVFHLVPMYNDRRAKVKAWPAWAIPVLAVVGLGVSGYLSYVEITHTEPICGPVGNCGAVQQSPYAVFMGVHVGVLGIFGYLIIAALWAFYTYGQPSTQLQNAKILWGLALSGTLFSIYLTFLEPFVIGATCAWCLTSALVMTLLLWAATPVVKEALARPKRRRKGRK